MKTLLTFALCLCAIVANAANPSTKSFRATGGLVVTSNDVTGIIIYDGSGISSPTGGVSATTVTNIVLGNGTRIVPGVGVTVVTNVTASNTIYTVSSSGTVISNANLLFVDTGGNDSTAKRGRRDLPYLTPYAAKTAAVAGDTVVVFPGNYANATNLLKGHVNWIGYGATLGHTNTTNDAGWGIFDARFSGAVTSRIEGFSFMYSHGLGKTNEDGEACCWPANTLGPIVITNPLTSVDISFDRIDYQELLQLNRGAALYLSDGTNCFIRGNAIQDMNLTTLVQIGTDIGGDPVYSVSVATGIYWRRGEHHVSVKRIESKFYSIWPTSTINDIGNMWFDGDYVLGKIYSDGLSTNNNWRSWYKIKELRTTATNSIGNPIELLGPGKFYFDLGKLGDESSSGTALGLSAASKVWLTAQKVSSTMKWFNLSGGSTLTATVGEFEDLGSVDKGISVVGGNLDLHGGFATVANATGSAIYHNSGNMTISGMRISATNSSAAPIILGTNGAVLSDCTILSKTGVWSVFSTNAQSAVLQSSRGNNGETNVAYLVGPWTVDSNVR